MRLERFNDKAHVILQDMLDYAEEKVVRLGLSERCNAVEYLALDYIKTCAEFIEHSTQYLENDERIGADLFLAKLAKGPLAARFERNKRMCALQLSTNTRMYFPEYPKLLRLAMMHVIQSAADAQAVRWNGVVLLAAASLPNVRTDVRRELRRRGMDYDVTLVGDATVARRIGRNSVFLGGDM
jgi:hypothetical protein